MIVYIEEVVSSEDEFLGRRARSSAEVMGHFAQMTLSANNRLTRTKTNRTILRRYLGRRLWKWASLGGRRGRC